MLRALTRTIRRRSGEAKSEVLKLTAKTGKLPGHRITATLRSPDGEVRVHSPLPGRVFREAGAALLDVREPYEWAAGHAAEATHVPLGQLSLDVIPDGEPLLVVCHVGGRSAMATQALRNAGLPAVNVAGGMAAWEQAGLPVVTDDGGRGRVV